MKIWKEFAADHSAKLKIVGKFKTIEDASKAAETINDLIEIDHNELESKSLIDGELGEVLKKHNLSIFNENDPGQMVYFSGVKPEGNTIVIYTDEVEIQALIKIFINFSAKINILSRHDYPNEY
jgi:hypothetical protein